MVEVVVLMGKEGLRLQAEAARGKRRFVVGCGVDQTHARRGDRHPTRSALLHVMYFESKSIVFILHMMQAGARSPRMRITVDIDDATLDDLVKMTGETKKSPAIAKAVNEYVRRLKMKEFGRLLREGSFDYPMTNDEVEKQGW